jgi:putative SOS response-associated peptidase YedK
MCGRYDLSDSPAAIRAKFSVPAVPDFLANWDLRPTDSAPVVRLATHGPARGERECALLRWGLVPSWAKDLKFGSRCINARAETVATAPAFRDAFRTRRCLVPVSAFYEWTGPVGRKTRWRIALDAAAGEASPFALAGLWAWWRDPAQPDAAGIETYTIVTTAANAQMAPIHDRMPVVLPKDRYAAWLDLAQDAQAVLDAAPPALSIVEFSAPPR